MIHQINGAFLLSERAAEVRRDWQKASKSRSTFTSKVR